MKKLENIPKIVQIPYGKGYYIFKLGKLFHDNDISINQFIKDTDCEHKVISKYIYGDLLTKFDMRVLATVCDYFDCALSDVIEYKKSS